METRNVADKARIIVTKNMLNADIAFLLGMLYEKNHLTYTHSVNVAYLAAQICMENGYSKLVSKQIVKGALLHDIGKLSVPLEIINKPAILTSSEKEIMKQHTQKGVLILKEIKSLRSSDIILDIVENHHERPDGTGYMHKTEVSSYAQLVRAIDIYDAVTSDRPYRPCFSSETAFDILKENNVEDYYIGCIENCRVR